MSGGVIIYIAIYFVLEQFVLFSCIEKLQIENNMEIEIMNSIVFTHGRLALAKELN